MEDLQLPRYNYLRTWIPNLALDEPIGGRDTELHMAKLVQFNMSCHFPLHGLKGVQICV